MFRVRWAGSGPGQLTYMSIYIYIDIYIYKGSPRKNESTFMEAQVYYLAVLLVDLGEGGKHI